MLYFSTKVQFFFSFSRTQGDDFPGFGRNTFLIYKKKPLFTYQSRSPSPFADGTASWSCPATRASDDASADCVNLTGIYSHLIISKTTFDILLLQILYETSSKKRCK